MVSYGPLRVRKEEDVRRDKGHEMGGGGGGESRERGRTLSASVPAAAALPSHLLAMKSPSSSEARSLASVTLRWEARRVETGEEDERGRRMVGVGLIERVSPLAARERVAILCKSKLIRSKKRDRRERRGREGKSQTLSRQFCILGYTSYYSPHSLVRSLSHSRSFFEDDAGATLTGSPFSSFAFLPRPQPALLHSNTSK